jgi:uncharacterized protein YcfL
MFKNWKSAAVCFSMTSALLILGGCSSTPSISEMTLRMRDTDDIKITDMRSIVNNGLLSVQVSLENKGSNKMISYRFRWLGKTGMQAGDDEAWKPLTIGSGQNGLISGIAPNPAVTDFKFELTSN